jgi:2-keto-myo-inositol isomerase
MVELVPVFEKEGVQLNLEPHPEDSCETLHLRYKEEAIEAIETVNGVDAFVVHDTFHHHYAGETKIFPRMTGLVHISGVVDATATVGTMRDPHRVLVGADDRIGNLEQLRALRAGGCERPAPFEPFATSVHASPDLEADLRKSVALVKAGLGLH